MLDVFHYILAPDNGGDALVVMAPPSHIAELAPSEINVLIETAGRMVQERGEYLAGTPNAYLYVSVLLGFREVHIYITWTLVDPSRFSEWLN